ncbi:MAG TPA: WD40 repeat domain-containing protein [Candidatus Bathyarchaeia archaeon]|nr:WD40 repeat domain-containing protein [Candidatus Bathyarchaeia archaeon]
MFIALFFLSTCFFFSAALEASLPLRIGAYSGKCILEKPAHNGFVHVARHPSNEHKDLFLIHDVYTSNSLRHNDHPKLCDLWMYDKSKNHSTALRLSIEDCITKTKIGNLGHICQARWYPRRASILACCHISNKDSMPYNPKRFALVTLNPENPTQPHSLMLLFHSTQIPLIAFSPDEFIAALAHNLDSTITLYRPQTPNRSWKNTDTIHDMIYANSGCIKCFFSSKNKTIVLGVQNLLTGGMINNFILDTQTNHCETIKVSPKGTYCIISQEKNFILKNTSTDTSIYTINISLDQNNSIIWSPDETCFTITQNDGRSFLYSIQLPTHELVDKDGIIIPLSSDSVALTEKIASNPFEGHNKTHIAIYEKDIVLSKNLLLAKK